MDTKETIELLNKEKKMMREGNVSLILDSYNDIFSDFDPRHFNERALSDDFLLECKRAARDKEIGFELRLLTPRTKRNMNEEILIKKRIKNHFQKHYFEKVKEIKKTQLQGIIWFMLGALLSLVVAFISTQQKNFLLNLTFVILEPASWFIIWSGLDKIFLDPESKKPEIKFYKKMMSADIHFTSY